jgi:hypothetical protein
MKMKKSSSVSKIWVWYVLESPIHAPDAELMVVVKEANDTEEAYF